MFRPRFVFHFHDIFLPAFDSAQGIVRSDGPSFEVGWQSVVLFVGKKGFGFCFLTGYSFCSGDILGVRICFFHSKSIF